MANDPAVDPRFTHLAGVVIDIAREIQLSAARTTPVVPLTPTQGQIMRFVHSHPDCSASEIADGAGLQRTNVSTALRELRGRGYLTSERDEADGRGIRIRATVKADETIHLLTQTWAGLIAEAWRSQPAAGDDDDLDTVSHALTRVRERLSADRTERAQRATNAVISEGPAAADVGADSIPTTR